MASTKKISLVDIYFIFLLASGFTNHVVLMPLLLLTAKRDAWLGVLLATILHMIWVYVYFAIIKRTRRQPLRIWFKERLGGAGSGLLLAAAFIFCFAMAVITLRETTTWIKATYLPQTPKVVVLLVLILLCVYIASNGLRSIAVMSGILLPFVWLLGHFVGLANLGYKNYSLLTPLFVDGVMPMLKSMVIAGGGLMEMVVLIFIQHHFSQQPSYLSLAGLAALLGGLALGPLIGAIANFGPEVASHSRYAAFDQWKLVTLSKYINHLDFLALYQWLAGAVIRIALFLFIISDMMPFKRRRRRLTLLLLMGAALAVLLLDNRVDRIVESYVLGEYFLIPISFLALLTLSIALTTVFKPAARGD
ncbi:endospore germination permease [Cohnella cellulosilytica]|uniref:Endospore germination permease n=1 Tax=Cohnella cellulosilytica TaxID=986710 RepID=A0ABW2F6P6_9BACL